MTTHKQTDRDGLCDCGRIHALDSLVNEHSDELLSLDDNSIDVDGMDFTGKIPPPKSPKIPADNLEEGICQICGREYPVWFAPNDLWNPVMRDPIKGDRYQFVCMDCFALEAEKSGIVPTGWKLTTEVSDVAKAAAEGIREQVLEILRKTVVAEEPYLSKGWSVHGPDVILALLTSEKQTLLDRAISKKSLVLYVADEKSRKVYSTKPSYAVSVEDLSKLRGEMK